MMRMSRYAMAASSHDRSDAVMFDPSRDLLLAHRTGTIENRPPGPRAEYVKKEESPA